MSRQQSSLRYGENKRPYTSEVIVADGLFRDTAGQERYKVSFQFVKSRIMPDRRRFFSVISPYVLPQRQLRGRGVRHHPIGQQIVSHTVSLDPDAYPAIVPVYLGFPPEGQNMDSGTATPGGPQYSDIPVRKQARSSCKSATGDPGGGSEVRRGGGSAVGRG